MDLISLHQSQINQICREDGISYLALFGSESRGEARSDSDVDLLVNYSKPVGLFKLYDTQEKFEKILNKKVDLVTVDGLKKQLRPYIEPDLKVLYENT